ncbi:MAG: hypothetical protein R3C03_06115 [Pirellulaceae bacterium]
MVETRDTINSFRDVSGKVTSNLDNLDSFTAELKVSGPEIVKKVNSSLDNVKRLTEQIETFADSIAKAQNGEGTLGKLLTDPSLYNNANDTVAHVKELVTKLEPMLNDLRMFSDAMARNPFEFGVPGILNRQRWQGGYKGNTVGRENAAN